MWQYAAEDSFPKNTEKQVYPALYELYGHGLVFLAEVLKIDD